MFYIVGKYKDINGEIDYILYESYTESVMIRKGSVIKQMVLNNKAEIDNVTIENGQIKLKKWPHKIIEKDRYGDTVAGCEYVLISRINETMFKVVSKAEYTETVRDTQLKNLIKEGRVANCDYIETEDGPIYRSTGMLNSSTDTKFKESIDKKYREFVAKSSLTGVDLGFEYTVRGNDVAITRYTGNSKKVIIPSFVTTIKAYVFYDRDIEQVVLNQGLKNIGFGAFQENKLSHVEIPETVELICSEAFGENPKLGNGANDTFSRYRVKIANRNALIFDVRINKLLGKESQ